MSELPLEAKDDTQPHIPIWNRHSWLTFNMTQYSIYYLIWILIAFYSLVRLHLILEELYLTGVHFKILLISLIIWEIILRLYFGRVYVT